MAPIRAFAALSFSNSFENLKGLRKFQDAPCKVQQEMTTGRNLQCGPTFLTAQGKINKRREKKR